VIAAGPDVTDAPEPYLHAGAEFALSGEGLAALLELVPRLDARSQGRSQDLVLGLPGVATLRAGKVTITNGARVLPNIELDSRPAWELLDIERYRDVWMRAHGYFSLNMAASRGCSFRCTWCAKPIWGNQYLQRDATTVAREMAHLKRMFQPDHVRFADDIFGFRVDWVAKFAAVSRELDGQVQFTIQTRADLVSERMADALSTAGCREAWIGAESGSQRVLDAMNKGTTVEEIRAARSRLRAAGIRVGFFIQLGYLDEQLDDILATRELLEESRPDDVGVSVSYPLPGTRFYEQVKEQMRGKTHWQESNDLAMMFQGTYTSEFYRTIRDLLHQQVALNAPGTSQPSASRHASKHSLERRWQELVSLEPQYRSCSAQSVAAL
jgi:anaerobic magnesium-protoporphyrin IX monomethyl ester cyclase